MIYRPAGINAFELATTASRRAVQLSLGCSPRIDERHSIAMMALLEVLIGVVTRADGSVIGGSSRDSADECRVKVNINIDI